MKSLVYLSFVILFLTTLTSCELFEKDEDTSIEGDQSPMGEVGTTVGSSSGEISGVSGVTAVVTSVKDGISTYSGSAVVKNTFLKNLLANFPEMVMKGDTVTTTNLKFQNTKEGIALKTGSTQGTLVKYDSEVGDEYPIDGTGEKRKVISKSTTDDYSYGFILIKVMKVEEYPTKLRGSGVNKVNYIANHKFGLVGVEFFFDDGTSAKFPLYTSAENK